MAKPHTHQEPTPGRILAALAAAGPDGLTEKALFRASGLAPRARGRFRETLTEMLLQGSLCSGRRGRFTGGGTAPEALQGILSLHPRGFGFVRLDNGETDVFIPPAALRGALSGDRVAVTITERDNPRGPAGRVVRIVEARPAEFVGQLEHGDGGALIRPLRRDLPESIPIHGVPPQVPGTDRTADGNGAWTTARLLRPTGPDTPLAAEVIRRFGQGNALEQTLDAVAEEFGLPPPYSPAEQAAAAAVKPATVPRENLESLPVVTIDPVDAKDFDDGISVQPGDAPGTVWVGIHIADVAAYVLAGSPLDAAAAARGFTSYLPGRTLPMLPAVIAGDRCSLLAGQPRAAHTVFVEVCRATGEVLRTRRCHAMIRVRQRLTFQEVQAYLATGAADGFDPGIRDTMTELASLYPVMRRRRLEQEEFLDLASTEVRVRCAENPPCIQELVREEANAAHALVEEFMLAANTAVAAELAGRDLPGIYRVHAEPRRTDLETFRDWAMENFALNVKRLSSRGAINRFLHGLEAKPNVRLLLTQECLRALPRAGYAGKVAAHFGLGKGCYCHFTSPIRRYADLVVHQQLGALDSGQPYRPAAECAEIAMRLTDREKSVDSAFFAANDRFKLFYLQARLSQEPGLLFEGVVARRTAEGMTVFLPDSGLLGFLTLNPQHGRHERTFTKRHPPVRGKAGKSYKCGDVIVAQAARIDCVRGTLLLRPCAARLSPAAPAAGKGVGVTRRRREVTEQE